MGPMSRNEKITLGVFAVLLVLWAGLLAPLGIKVDATTTTFLGISLLLLTGVLTWDDVLKRKRRVGHHRVVRRLGDDGNFPQQIGLD